MREFYPAISTKACHDLISKIGFKDALRNHGKTRVWLGINCVQNGDHEDNLTLAQLVGPAVAKLRRVEEPTVIVVDIPNSVNVGEACAAPQWSDNLTVMKKALVIHN